MRAVRLSFSREGLLVTVFMVLENLVVGLIGVLLLKITTAQILCNKNSKYYSSLLRIIAKKEGFDRKEAGISLLARV